MENDINALLRKKFLRAIKGLPKVIANEAENISLDAFKQQAWNGVSWPARQPGAKRPNRPLLVDSDALRRGTYAIVESPTLIIWGNNVRYARIHNDGGVIVQAARSETFLRNRTKLKKRFKRGVTKGVKGFTFRERRIVMPQRKFMGNAPFVIQRLIRVGKNHLAKQIA